MFIAEGLPEDINKSEEKKLEALGHINGAKQLQASGAPMGDVDNEWGHAIRLLENALVICPGNHLARFLLVSCFMNCEDYRTAREEASKLYDELSTEKKQKLNDPILHLTLARTCQLLEEPREAEHFAREATTLFPECPQPYMLLGEVYEQLGLFAESEQECRQALFISDLPECKAKLDATDVYQTLCCLGNVLTGQGKYTEAEMALSRALEIDRRDQPAYRCLIQTYLAQNKKSIARQIAQRCLSLYPDDLFLRDTLREIDFGDASHDEDDDPPSATETEKSTVGPLPPRARSQYNDAFAGTHQSVSSSDRRKLKSLQRSINVLSPEDDHHWEEPQSRRGSMGSKRGSDGGRSRSDFGRDSYGGTRSVGSDRYAESFDGSRRDSRRRRDDDGGDHWLMCCLDHKSNKAAPAASAQTDRGYPRGSSELQTDAARDSARSGTTRTRASEKKSESWFSLSALFR